MMTIAEEATLTGKSAIRVKCVYCEHNFDATVGSTRTLCTKCRQRHTRPAGSCKEVGEFLRPDPQAGGSASSFRTPQKVVVTCSRETGHIGHHVNGKVKWGIERKVKK